MKKILPFIVVVILLSNCRDSENFYFQPQSYFEKCVENFEINVPNGIIKKELSTINYKGSLHTLQFIDDNVGFMYGNNTFGGYPDIFKTEDGGNSWKNLNIKIYKSPYSFCFKNSNIGFISVFDNQGCPENCSRRCILMKTVDGGSTWNEIIYPNLKGEFHHIQFDDSGNLYAVLNLIINKSATSDYSKTTKVVKSSNDGLSWEILYESPDINFTSITFSFILRKNELFVSGNLGKIHKIDTKGNLIETIETGQKYIRDLRIIDDKNFIVDGPSGILKSNDGGKMWVKLFSGQAQIIDFLSLDKGFLLTRESLCGAYDYPDDNNTIAYTNDGGVSWSKSELSTNLFTIYGKPKKFSNNRLITLFRNKVVELKIQ